MLDTTGSLDSRNNRSGLPGRSNSLCSDMSFTFRISGRSNGQWRKTLNDDFGTGLADPLAVLCDFNRSSPTTAPGSGPKSITIVNDGGLPTQLMSPRCGLQVNRILTPSP
jgi:hypothetical protein